MLGSAVVLFGVTLLIYVIIKRFLNSSKTYWKQYGIRQLDASKQAPFWELVLGRKDVSDRDAYAYDVMSATGEKFVGISEFNQKAVVVKDIELIKKILIKDFDYFANRRDFFEWADENHVVKKMMVSMNGEKWRDLRHTLSPSFSTGKIRRMMEFFNSVGKEWITSLNEKAKMSGGSVDINVVSSVSQYTVDVIAAAVFGMRAGTIQNEKSPFATMAHRFLHMNKYKMILATIIPGVMRTFGVNMIDLEAVGWLENILNQGLQERLKDGAKRKNDFLQLLVDARNGELKNVAEEEELNEFEKQAQQKNGKEVFLTDDYLNAQSLLFFIAGFSTTTNFISFALYALAAYPKIQEKLRKEIDTIVKEDGNLDYDDVGKLTYLEMFVSEVLRKFPPIARLERFVSKEYIDKESGLHLPKGTLVIVPTDSMQKDPKYYPNPHEFDPEGNFDPEARAERSPYVFLPFGSGPRNCIGMRFALIEAKSAIAHVVHNFKIEPNKNTPLPINVQPIAVQLIPPKTLEVRLTPIKS